MVRKLLALLVVVGFAVTVKTASADGRFEELSSAGKSESSASTATLKDAGVEQLAQATGHYAKSRSLLLAAIREFDAAYKLASPDALIDSKTFRNTLITRAQELEHVLDPQPRASKGGVSFNPDSRLLGAGR